MGEILLRLVLSVTVLVAMLLSHVLGQFLLLGRFVVTAWHCALILASMGARVGVHCALCLCRVTAAPNGAGVGSLIFAVAPTVREEKVAPRRGIPTPRK